MLTKLQALTMERHLQIAMEKLQSKLYNWRQNKFVRRKLQCKVGLHNRRQELIVTASTNK
jgi:hypothetical protein